MVTPITIKRAERFALVIFVVFVPARHSVIVALFCRNPVSRRPRFAMFLFPERRVGFHEIHEKFGGFKSGLPVLRGGYDKNDIFARFYRAVTVNCRHTLQGPPGVGFGNYAFDFIFGHAWIMLEFECFKAAIVTAQAGKGDYRTNIATAFDEALYFDACIKIFLLYRYAQRFIPRSLEGKRRFPAPRLSACPDRRVPGPLPPE